jgi:hypothetical protein
MAVRHAANMSKRNLATILWFLSGWTFGSMLTLVFGLPGGLDVVFSVLAGGLIWADPAGLLWRRSQMLGRPAEVVPAPTLATE